MRRNARPMFLECWVAREIRSALEAVRELAIHHGAPPGGSILTLSVGVWVCRPRPGDLLEDCVAQADQRLYRAKSGGRDRIAA